ncbi:MAG TPA: MBL fold metallo-hydrolase [Candidatus Obscuribacterales bacterium]
MFLRQVTNQVLALCSYFIADEKTRSAVVVDPQSDIDVYLELANEHHFEIRYVFLTHTPSEFVAGHEKLARRLNATIVLGPGAEALFDFMPAADGDEFELGDLRIAVVSTPGHTEDAICLLIYDLNASKDRPVAVMTGDTLYRADCGRPDLLAVEGHTYDHMSALLYDSIQTRLSHLPGGTLVYPGHAYGSIEAGVIVDSTIDDESESNFAIQSPNRGDFVEIMAAYSHAGASTGPPFYMNRGSELPDYARRTKLKALSFEQVLEWQREGALVIDFRSVQRFAGAHLAGSINLPSFANLTCLNYMAHVRAVVVCDPGEEEKAVETLTAAGFDMVVGFLRGGMAAHGLSTRHVGRLRRFSGTEVLRQLMSSNAPLLVDLRSSTDWKLDGFATSVNMPFAEFFDRASALRKDDPIVLYCQSEFFSGIAGSILKSQGYRRVATLLGGMTGWRHLKSKLGPRADIVGPPITPTAV